MIRKDTSLTFVDEFANDNENSNIDPSNDDNHTSNDYEPTIELEEILTVDNNQPQTNDLTRKKSEFNWEKDDTSSINKTVSFFSKLPIFIKYLLYSLAGSSLFMLPGLLSFFLCVDNVGQPFRLLKSTSWFSLEGLPVLFWSVFFSASWSVFFGIKYSFKVFPEILVRVSNLFLGVALKKESYAIKASHIIDYTRHLHSYLTCLVWALLNLIIHTWIFIIPNPPSYATLSRINLSLVVFFGVFLIEKFFLQVFAVQFHKRAYSERLEIQNFHEKVLERLSKARKKTFFNGVANSSSASEKGFGSSSFSPSTENLKGMFKGINTKFVNGFSGVGRGVAEVASVFAIGDSDDTTKAGVRQYGSPYKFAKRVFEGLVRENSGFIILEDFLPYFRTKEEAVEAFKVFDKDGNGDIEKSEMKNCIVEIFKEQTSLELSMHQSSQAIDKLDSILKLFCFVVILFVILGIFNINTSSFLTVAISLWAGLLFALGGTIKNLFESMIFLFVTHPYDVGDKVEIEGIQYFVKEFWLNTT
ncbi:hypothetical protein HK099_001980, partial [Clydaea vesicula]